MIKVGNYCDQYLGKEGITIEMHCLNNKDDFYIINKLNNFVNTFITSSNEKFYGLISRLFFF